MMRRLGRIFTVATLLTSMPVFCGAKSIFNLNFLGERVEAGDVRAIALGGSYIVIADSLGMLQLNPAMVSYTQRVTIAATSYVGTSGSESELYKERGGDFKFTALGIAFPIMRLFSVGLQYRAETDPTGQFSVPRTTDSGEPYDDEFERSGGLSSYSLIVGANIGPRLKLGFGATLESGRMTDTWRIGFSPLTGQDAFSQQERTMVGQSVRAGVVLRPLAGVSLGLSYKARVEYDTDVDIRQSNTSANDSYEETIVVPEQWSASGSWKVLSNWTVYAGGQYSDYKKFEGLAFPTDRLRTQRVLSVGAEQLRGTLRLPLRFSFSYETLPYTLPANEEVKTVSITLGTGLKLGGGRGKIDLALRIGQTGSISTNGFEDRFVRLYIGIAGSEAWRRARADNF